MAKEKKTKELRPGYVVPKKELSSFAFGAMGQGMIYAMMSSYISDYYVNILQLPMMFVPAPRPSTKFLTFSVVRL